MRNGKLNKQERDTLLRAQKILNKWVDWQEENTDADLEDYTFSMACNAAGGIAEFIYQTRGE